MTDSSLSRRSFVQTSGAAVGSVWAAVHLPAIQATAALAHRAFTLALPFDVLSDAEAREVEAVAAQIFPTDDTPGATEAGVVYFVDRALGGFAAGSLEPIRGGLVDLRQAAHAKNPAAASFADLSVSEQTEVLRGMEKTPFFGAMYFLTVAGMFADPSYGGNRNGVGWTLLGFEGAHAYQPPFGYYDDPAHEEER